MVGARSTDWFEPAFSAAGSPARLLLMLMLMLTLLNRRCTGLAAGRKAGGLLRQYFPKGTDLSIHSAADLDWVAQELNDRPRKRLEFRKPIELTEDLLLQ